MAQFGLDDIYDWIEAVIVAFVSLRDFTLDPLGDLIHPSEKYLQYITKASRQAPHLESFTIDHGPAFRFKQVNENWVVCDEDEYPAP